MGQHVSSALPRRRWSGAFTLPRHAAVPRHRITTTSDPRPQIAKVLLCVTPPPASSRSHAAPPRSTDTRQTCKSAPVSRNGTSQLARPLSAAPTTAPPPSTRTPTTGLPMALRARMSAMERGAWTARLATGLVALGCVLRSATATPLANRCAGLRHERAHGQQQKAEQRRRLQQSRWPARERPAGWRKTVAWRQQRWWKRRRGWSRRPAGQRSARRRQAEPFQRQQPVGPAFKLKRRWSRWSRRSAWWRNGRRFGK